MPAAPLASTPFEPLYRAQDDLIDAVHAGSREAIWRSTEALCGEIRALERQQYSRAEIVGAIAPARALHAESPFVLRLQTWPRGYPGDFETIEYLVGGANLAPRGTGAWWIEQIALSSPIAVQHRCKVRRQAEEIRRVCEAHPGARVLILACGGGRDLQVLLDQAVTLPGAHITLVDQDADALTLASDRADTLGAVATPLCMDVIRGLRRAKGPFDLILAGGLFDYLQDSTIVLLLKLARRKLGPDGRIFFTNIAAANPFRIWIEYLADWHLIERDASSLGRLAAQAELATEEVRTESTGLSVIAVLRRMPPVVAQQATGKSLAPDIASIGSLGSPQPVA